MPWYTSLPADWQAEIEKKTGAHPYVEVIYDPDEEAISLTGKYDLIGMSALSNARDLDLEWGARAIIPDVELIFADPDGYFDPRNADGILYDCYMELDRDHVAGETSIKLFPKTGATFKAGSQVRINDGAHSELITVNAFTASSGTTYYHEITSASGLANGYSAGARVYTTALEGRDVLIWLKMTGCSSYISLSRCRTIRLPEVVSGKAKLICSDFKKLIHDLPLIGADASEDKKLMKIGPDGSLVSSVLWTGGWGTPPYAWCLSAGSLPAGLSIEPSTGVISGTPNETGTFTPTISVSNSNDQACSADLILRIDAANYEDFDGTYGPYSVGKDATLWSLAVRSGWARCAFTSKYLRWNSTDNDDSQYLRRAYSGTTWALKGKLVVTSAPAVGFQAGLAVKNTSGDGIIFGFYNAANRVVVRGITQTSSFSCDSTDAAYAAGLEFLIRKVSTAWKYYFRAIGETSWGTEVADRSLTGTLATVGLAIVTTASGSGTIDVDYLKYFIGVLSIVSSAISKGNVGFAYSSYVEAQGGVGDYVYSVSVGSLPLGLELNATSGEIFGTPVEAKSTTFTILVTDGLGSTVTQQFTIEVVDEIAIVPTVLRRGINGTAYSAALSVNPTGDLDRTQITVGANCRLGKWTFAFTSDSDFTADGPGVSGLTGNVDTEFSVADVLTVPAEAWSGNIKTGDVMTFITAISWEHENPVQVLHEVIKKTTLPANLLNESSYFGDKAVGKVYEAVSAGATTLKIAVTVPTVLEKDEILTITEGATSEEVTVSTGNTESASYPPYVELGISASINAYTTAATVAWKDRTSLSLGKGYSFDDEYDYAEKAGLDISLSLDREMSFAQAIEVISAHLDGFLFHDNWGIDRVHVLRPRNDSSLTTLDSSVIKAPGATVETIELINEIVCRYGYDYENNEYLFGFTYPASDADNKSLLRNVLKRSVQLDLPGFYSESQAMALARRKYLTREAGLHQFTFSTTLKGLLIRIGERYVLSSLNANFTDVVEIVGLKSVSVLDDVNFEFIAYDRSQFKDFFIVGLSKVGLARVW